MQIIKCSTFAFCGITTVIGCWLSLVCTVKLSSSIWLFECSLEVFIHTVQYTVCRSLSIFAIGISAWLKTTVPLFHLYRKESIIQYSTSFSSLTDHIFVSLSHSENILHFFTCWCYTLQNKSGICQISKQNNDQKKKKNLLPIGLILLLIQSALDDLGIFIPKGTGAQ